MHALLVTLLLACAPKHDTTPMPVAAPVVVPDPLDTRPVIAAPASYTPPTPQAATLSNGASVWVLPNHALPLVTVMLQVSGGAALDATGKEGTAALSDRMLKQGAGARDAEAFSAQVERLGIQLDVGTGRSSSYISMSMRKDVVDDALDLMADMVLRPRWAAKDFLREKELAASDVQVSLDELPVVASRVAFASWFGAGHPFSHPPEGTVAGLKAVSLKELKAYHTAAWNAAGASFTVSGDLSDEEAVNRLQQRFGSWKASKPALPTITAAPAHDATTWVMVDKPGAAQTMFYLLFPGLGVGDPALTPVRSGTIVLGGTFTSRLNGLLREKRGYTYGVRASVAALPQVGVLTVGTRIRADVTTPAMVDIVGELKRIQEGVNTEELVKAQGAYKQDQVEAMETRAGGAAAFAAYQGNGLPPTALAAELVAMQGVSAESVKAAMSRYDLKHALVVLVGDRATIEKPLTDAGFGPFTITPAL